MERQSEVSVFVLFYTVKCTGSNMRKCTYSLKQIDFYKQVIFSTLNPIKSTSCLVKILYDYSCQKADLTNRLFMFDPRTTLTKLFTLSALCLNYLIPRKKRREDACAHKTSYGLKSETMQGSTYS